MQERQLFQSVGGPQAGCGGLGCRKRIDRRVASATVHHACRDLGREGQPEVGPDSVDRALRQRKPSVPMKVRHLAPGNLDLRALKDSHAHAHAGEAD